MALFVASRALDPDAPSNAGTLRTKRWALDLIEKMVADLGRGAFLLMPRAADGPMAWARDAAMRAGVTVVEFASSGRRYVQGVVEGDWTSRWCPDFATLPTNAREDARNGALVAALAHARDEGAATSVHALLTPWVASVTLRVLVRQVRAARFRPVQHECPVRYYARRLRGASGLDDQGVYRGSHVYFVENGRGFVKIGWSEHLAKRFYSLQTGSPERLRLVLAVPGGRQTERFLHGIFADYRVNGEWFLRGRRIGSFVWKIARLRQERPLSREDVIAIGHECTPDKAA